MIKSSVLLTLIVILSMLLTNCSNERINSINVWILGMQTTVYDELKIADQWQEVNLLKPLDSGIPIHYIVLELEGEDSWQFLGKEELKNSQGQLMDIEVQLVDENGKVYQLEPSFLNRGEAQFWINYERVNGGKEFPKPISGKPVGDVIFTKLRIKSNNPFTCTKIIWQRYHI